jgi:hypothetical protein
MYIRLQSVSIRQWMRLKLQVFCNRDVAGAAERVCGRGSVGRLEGYGPLFSQFRAEENVGRVYANHRGSVDTRGHSRR